ncbi:WD40 repeat-like protein [Schizophyllum fasciatum]
MSSGKDTTGATDRILRTPAQVTALALVSRDGSLVAGSADGTLRVYDLANGRVSRAVRGLGDEVAAIAVEGAEETKGKGGKAKDANATDADEKHPLRLWAACGRKALHFDLSATAPMLQTSADARAALDLCDADEADDALNGLTLHPRGTHLAFCTDAGAVGVVELDAHTRQPASPGPVRRMRARHANLASAALFVPARARELVSGGYDCALLHADWESGAPLARAEVGAGAASEFGGSGVAASELGGGLALSPPFVLALAMSPAGALAAGLADGRVWVGLGGEREPTAAKKGKSKKRTKKWEGLDARGVRTARVAEGPVVGVAWRDESALLACSLLGQVTEVVLERGAPGGMLLRHRVVGQTREVSKVNALVVGGQWVVVGGVGREGKGVVEVVGVEALGETE